MPVADENVTIAYYTQQEFNAIQTKDENTIYFITDTNTIFVGNSQYCNSIVVCTQEEYDAMQTKTGLVYFIKES